MAGILYSPRQWRGWLTEPNRGRSRDKVLVVALIVRDTTRSEVEEHLEELGKLVESAGGTVAGSSISKRSAPDPSTFIGSGKAAELKQVAAEGGVSLLVVDADLTPAQARNLEEIVGIRVIDRSGLILDIFARRARSREARTQVELAQLQYLLPRLTRHWSHLSRQAGGIGTRGVGETQLEIDRRIVRDRISRLREELSKIEKTRATQRKSRKHAFTVALVGYTNAGKSTLFNQLTRGNAESADKLFATLDAKMQKAHFPTPRETVMIDTVGFIRKLPHNLVASFRSTMEEAASADLVLHLVDASHPQADEQKAVGQDVLKDLAIKPEKVIEVFNKADRLDGSILMSGNGSRPLWVSALTGAGCDRLIEKIRERQLAEGDVLHLKIPAAETRLVAKLHDSAAVYEEKMDGEQASIIAWVPHDLIHLFEPYTI